MRKSYLIVWGIVAAMFVTSAYFYTDMPDEMTTHWDFQSQPDGFMGKAWGLFIIPIFTVFLAMLFVVIPRIDPLRNNIMSFMGYYEKFIIIFFLFMLAIQIQMIMWNSGFVISFALFMPPALAILFYYVGIMCEHAKKNWFIGIRTPWTLSSDRVWDKTNKLAGKLFKISALIVLVGTLFPGYFILFIMAPILIAGIYPVFYSYFEYQKETAGK